MGFLSLHQNAGRVFYFQIKQIFSYKNTLLPIKHCETLVVFRPAFWVHSTHVLVNNYGLDNFADIGALQSM